MYYKRLPNLTRLFIGVYFLVLFLTYEEKCFLKSINSNAIKVLVCEELVCGVVAGGELVSGVVGYRPVKSWLVEWWATGR